MENKQIQEEIVLEVLPNEGKIITISTDYDFRSPIKHRFLSQTYSLEPGTLIEYQDDKIIAEHDFYDHNYDIAVVLDVTKKTRYNKICNVYEIYGLKSRKTHVVKEYNEWDQAGFRARGDLESFIKYGISCQVASLENSPKVSVGHRLLMSSSGMIIHNITKARLIYELQKDFGQLK